MHQKNPTPHLCRVADTKVKSRRPTSGLTTERFPSQTVGESVVASIGLALFVCALGANQRWLDRHFLPAYNVSRHAYVLVESFARIVSAAIGPALALVVRRRLWRFVARVPAATLAADAARVALAVVLALGA